MDILAKYEEYAREGTDAPTKYHKFCAAAVVGCLMGRRLWYRQGHTPIFPHLWICLLGRSTWMRKSTAIGIAERVVAKANEDLIFTSKVSIEKLYGIVSKTNWGMLLYPELQTLLAMMGRDFNAEFKSTLTHWYDAPYMSKYATMGMGGEEIIVRRPSITILGGSTMEWLLEAAKTKDIAGGFYPRWLFDRRHQIKTNFRLGNLRSFPRVIRSINDNQNAAGPGKPPLAAPKQNFWPGFS